MQKGGIQMGVCARELAGPLDIRGDLPDFGVLGRNSKKEKDGGKRKASRVWPRPYF